MNDPQAVETLADALAALLAVNGTFLVGTMLPGWSQLSGGMKYNVVARLVAKYASHGVKATFCIKNVRGAPDWAVHRTA